MTDPLAEFRAAEHPKVHRQHPNEWPATLEIRDSDGDIVTAPEPVADGIPPDGEPGADDIARIFAAWGLDQNQWEIEDGTIAANVWPMVIASGEVRLFRQWKAKLRRKGSRADVGPVLDGIRRLRPRKRRSPANGRTRVLAVADPQMGKAGAEGSGAIAERWMDAVQRTLDDETRARKLGYGTDTLVLALMGDLIESCSSTHDSQPFELDLHLTDQIKVVHECVWQTVKAVAPEWETVHVAAVPGNHGEVRSRKGGGIATSPSDNFDVAIPDMVRRSIVEMNPEPFAHVDWWMPRGDELTVVLPLERTLGLAHGHQFAGGGDPLTRATKWWADHLVNDGDSELAAVDVMLVGHWHHFRVQRSGTRTLILCPSLENPEGSRWFQNKTGANCPPGVLTFVLDGEHRWGVRNLEVH